MYTEQQLRAAKSQSRKLREQQRVRVRKSVRGRPRGRPIRHSGTYYARHILISDQLWLKVKAIKMPNEPFGSALDRYVGLAEQKKLIALPIKEDYHYEERSLLDNPEEYKKVWEMFDKR